VVAAYVASEKPGQKADPLKEAALAAKLPIYQPASYRKPEVWEEFRALKHDLQVSGVSLPCSCRKTFLNIPTHGSIQYHPVALAGLSRPERDQLADHQGRDRDRVSRSSGLTTGSIPAMF